MAIIDAPRRPVLDLRGPEGNVFFVFGSADRFAKQMGLDPDEIEAELKAAGNYRGVIRAYEKRFGELVDIILPESWNGSIDEPEAA